MIIHSFSATDSNRSIGEYSAGEVAEFMKGVIDVAGTLARDNANKLSQQGKHNVLPVVAVDWHAEGDFDLGVPEQASTPYVRLVDIGNDELLAKTIELALATGLPIVFDYSRSDEANDDIQDVTLDVALMKDKKIPTIVIEFCSGVVTEKYRQIARAVSARLLNHYGMISNTTKMNFGMDQAFRQLPKIPRDQPLRLRDSFGIDPNGNRIQGGDAILLRRNPGDYVTKGL